jgi:hypothetical protein
MILDILKKYYLFMYNIIASAYLIGSNFTNKIPDLDLTSIYNSCIRSNLAYSDETEIIKLWEKKEDSIFLNIDDKPEFYYDIKTTAFGYSLYNKTEKTVYLSFRGTDDLQDVCYDLKDKLIDATILGDNIKVHQGFYEQFISISKEIDTKLETLEFNTIYLTGHSLGASIATIASLYYKLKFSDKKIILQVFGSPRTGNIEFKHLLENKVDQYYRIVNNVDPVNNLPVYKTYCHIGNCITIKENGTLRLTNEDTPWNKRILITLLHLDIADHSFIEYLSNLKKLL